MKMQILSWLDSKRASEVVPVRAHPVINKGAFHASLAHSTSRDESGLEGELIWPIVPALGQTCGFPCLQTRKWDREASGTRSHENAAWLDEPPVAGRIRVSRAPNRESGRSYTDKVVGRSHHELGFHRPARYLAAGIAAT